MKISELREVLETMEDQKLKVVGTLYQMERMSAEHEEKQGRSREGRFHLKQCVDFINDNVVVAKGRTAETFMSAVREHRKKVYANIRYMTAEGLAVASSK